VDMMDTVAPVDDGYGLCAVHGWYGVAGGHVETHGRASTGT
jgi:hypothetical protein